MTSSVRSLRCRVGAGRRGHDVALSTSSLNVLSICSGVGGLELGLRVAEPDARTVCYVEGEAYAAAVLAARMAEGRLDQAPVWSDLRTFDGRPWRGLVDCIAGGYPCQPFSVAGKRLGTDDPRHLWPHVARIIAEIGPRLCFFENVRGHLSCGFDVVTRDLCNLGYRVEAGIFTAAEVGAPHERARLFIMAHADGAELRDQPGGGFRPGRSDPPELRHDGEIMAHTRDVGRKERPDGNARPIERTTTTGRSETVANADNERCESIGRGGLCDRGGPTQRDHSHGYGGEGLPFAYPPRPDDADAWRVALDKWPDLEPAFCRVVNGVAHRVDRLRACGNGVVPKEAALAWRTLSARFG